MVTIIKVKYEIDNNFNGMMAIAYLGGELFGELKRKGLIHSVFNDANDNFTYAVQFEEVIKAGYKIELPNGDQFGPSSNTPGKMVYVGGKTKKFDTIGELEAFVKSGANKEA